MPDRMFDRLPCLAHLLLGALILVMIEGITLGIAYAQPQTKSSPATIQDEAKLIIERSKIAVLPVQGAGNVAARYIKRLQDSLPPATELDMAAQRALAALPARPPSVVPCVREDACLAQVGRELFSLRMVGMTIEANERDFVVVTHVVDVPSGRTVAQLDTPIAHRDLASAGVPLLKDVLAKARLPLAALHTRDEEVSATQPPIQEEVAQSEREDEDQPQPPEPTPAPEPATVATPTTPTPPNPYAGATAKVVQLSAEDLNGRLAEAQDVPYANGPMAPRPSAVGLLAEGTGELERPDRAKNSKAFKDRLVAAYTSDDFAERNKRRQELLLASLVGLFFFSVTFATAYLYGRTRKTRLVSVDGDVSPKEAAATTTILRACARNITPGILLSPEFETCKRFSFALLQGKQVSLDVMDVADADRAALRVGQQLCAQFVHEASPVICMMTIVRTQRLSPRRLRITCGVPPRLAQLSLPNDFPIPVDKRVPLLVQVVQQEEKRTLTWQANAASISHGTLQVSVDEDALTLAQGDHVAIALRLDKDRAELNGEVSALDDDHITFTLADKHGGTPPREYQSMLRKLEGHWLAGLGPQSI